MPDTISTPVVIEIAACYECRDQLFKIQSRNVRAFHTQRVTTYALERDPSLGDTKEVWAHDRCTFTCTVCRKRSTNTSKEGWFNDSDTCRPCYKKIISERITGEIEVIACAAHGNGRAFYDAHHPGIIWSEFRDQYMCRTCYDAPIRCRDCNDRMHENDWDMHDCNEENDSDSNFIHNYSYKPVPIFYGSDTPYGFGIELEVESMGSDFDFGSELAHRSNGERIYLKYDGSLNHGFEIVTHPHTLKEFQTNFNWTFLSKLQDLGFRSWNTRSCGLHVHVSRTAFSTDIDVRGDSHQIKFMKLIYDNEQQVKRIAGRSSTYAAFNDKGGVVRKVKSGRQRDGRYSAVNTDNRATLEIRVFRGSLRKERVLSAVEFVAAAIEYTRNLRVTGKSNSFAWVRFVGYVNENSETYPNLFIILNELFERDRIPTNTSSEEDN